MRVAFLYNESSEDPGQAAEDADAAHSPVVAALRRLGHAVTRIACTLDLSALRRRLKRSRPEVVLNRVESLGGSDAMMAAIPLLLETLQIPYTGCSAEALAATAGKVSVKQRLLRAGLPTPPWITADGARHGVRDEAQAGPKSTIHHPKYIVKSVYEHSSFQLDESSIVGPAGPTPIMRLLRQREAEFGRPFFAEQFIDGREFNVSIIGRKPRVLPLAEIDFSEFPPGKPHIVGHGAKCDATSFEYHHTPRRFDFPAADGPLLRRLSKLAAKCSRVFHLDGYARIDFRCDADCQPWILEINTNPCLSPNTGFPAAVERAGYQYDDGIQLLLDEALNHLPQRPQFSRKSRGRSPAVAADAH